MQELGVSGEDNEANAAQCVGMALIHVWERLAEQVCGVLVVAYGVEVAVTMLEVVPSARFGAASDGDCGRSAHVGLSSGGILRRDRTESARAPQDPAAANAALDSEDLCSAQQRIRSRLRAA